MKFFVDSHWSVLSDFTEERPQFTSPLSPGAERRGEKSHINSDCNLPRLSAPGLAGDVFSPYKQGLRELLLLRNL